MGKSILFIVLFTCLGFAANAQLKVPKKVQQQMMGKPTSTAYDYLMHKDIGTVMKALSITDTIGKTKRAFFPQAYPGVPFTVLSLPNGESLAFHQIRGLSVIIPKQEK